MTHKKHADLVQYIINQWHQFDPQLDTSGTEIIGRIVRISSIVGRSVDKNLDRFQMTVGEFDVLAALAREKKTGINAETTARPYPYFIGRID